MKIDELDCRLLEEVQKSASLTLDQLADRSGSTPSTCQRRLRRLQSEGYIEGFVAVPNSRLSAEPLTSLFGITLIDQSARTQQEFASAMRGHRKVRMAWMTTGEFDYMLLASFQDEHDLSKFVDSFFVESSLIHTFRTFISLNEVKMTLGRTFTAAKR